MAISETLARWQQAGDEHLFKIIVSPEFGDKMDLRQHVKELIAQMEKDLGTKLQWVAIDHFNTDNPHVHVTIRGVDDRGQVLEVSPAYIKEGSRIRAQEAATRQLGYRSEKDVAEALERQVSQQRFTDLDRSLLRAANEHGDPNIDFAILKAAKAHPRMEMDFSGKPPANEKARDMRLKQIRRLAYLETLGLAQRIGEMKWKVSPDLATAKPQGQLLINFDGPVPKGDKARDMRLKQIRRLTQLVEMGLAEKVGNMAWRLNPAMESALRQMQVSQDRLKTKFQHREMISDPSAQLVTTELKTLGQRVAGKFVGAGLNEQTNRAYMLIEGFDGKVHYVNQSPKVQKLRGTGELKAGDFVALEVVNRKDQSGKVVGEMVRVDHYGRAMPPEALDKELLKSGKAVERISTQKTVAGAYLAAASARLAKLQRAGAVEVQDGRVVEKSRLAYDQVRFEDAGIRAMASDGKGPMLAKLLAKGRESIAVETVRGQRLILTGEQLAGLGLEQKFVSKDATIFVGQDAKGKPMAAIIKLDQVPAMIQDPRPNRLDLMTQQLGDLPADHPLASAIKQRVETWKQRGVDVKSEEFGKDAAIWRKNMELAMSPELQNMVDGRKLNRLDWMLQQAYQPTTAPLEEALQKRADTWLQRGVDPKDAKFSLQANVWRKSVELHEAAHQKGVETVLEELSKDRGKPTRELQCEPGRQISGRVLLVNRQADQTTVVVDTGRELTVIRQPAPNEADLKAGQRIRARAEEINDKNIQRRVMLWRFADLEREQARQKGREGKAF